MHPEKFRLDQIQNGPLSAIINFHMPIITKCEVSVEFAPLNFLTSLYRIQNDRKSAIIHLDLPDIG